MKPIGVTTRSRLSYLPLVGESALFITFIILLSWAWAYDNTACISPEKSDLGVIRHVIHYSLPISQPRKARSTVQIDAKGLLPGDILAASKPGSEYGYFTHITSLINSNEALGHNVAYGIFRIPVTDLKGYDHVRVLRADISPQQRLAVSNYLKRIPGRVFHLLAHKRDDRLWNCAKSVWAAYRTVGIDLAPFRNYIVPDDVANSSALRVVREWKGR